MLSANSRSKFQPRRAIPNLSVNRTACKVRLQVPSGLRRPVTSNVGRTERGLNG